MKRHIAIFAGLMLALLTVAAVTQVDWLTNIKNKPQFDAREYNFGAQAPGGSLSAGVPASITLRPVPRGVNGTDTAHWVYLSGGTGTAESVLVTGGTSLSGGTSGTITFTPANAHSGAWHINSATAGMQEAANSAAAVGGGTVHYSGTHATYAPIAIASNIELTGDNLGSSIITCTGGDYDCISLSGAVGSAVRRIMVSGSGRTGGFAINTSPGGAGRVILEDLYLDNTGSGISLENCTVIQVSRATITNMPSGYGILISGTGGDARINDVIIDNSGTYAFAGIDVQASGGTMINHVDVIHCTYALLVNPPLGQIVVALEVAQSWFDTSTNGIYVLPASAGAGGAQAVTDFRCTDCWAVSNAERGVSVGGSVQDINFKGLVSFNNGQYGVVIGSDSVNILDSTIASNSQSSNGTYHNILVGNNVSNWRIQNSTLGGDYFTVAEKAGYNLVIGGTSTNFIVSGNTFNATITAPILDASTGTNGRIEGNTGYNPAGLFSVTPGASPYTYRAGHSPEIVYFSGGTVSAIDRAGALTVATSTATPVGVPLPPNGTVRVTYTGAPTMVKDVQ